MIKKFIGEYKYHKKIFILDMLASFIISISGLMYPIVSRSILNDFIPNRKFRMIIIWGIILLGIYLIRMLLRYFVAYYGHVMGVKMQARMRTNMFKHLEELPFEYFDNNETGKIMSRMTNDLMEVSELAHHGPEIFFTSIFLIIATFIYLLTIEWHLTLIIFVTAPILIAIALIYQGKMNEAFMQTRKEIAVINSRIENSISGIRTTKAFQMSEYEIDRFEDGNQAFVKARSKAYKRMGEFQSVTTFITEIFNLIVIIAGAIFVYQKMIDFADLTAFIISINVFITPLKSLIDFTEQFQNGITGYKRYIEIMDEKAEMDEEDSRDDLLDGDIEFKNVGFKYNDSKDVIADLSLKIKKGCKVAFVGPSGGGKTTICHLIPRFYNITSGHIYIDNHDISKVTLKSLRDNIGIVQQDVLIFNGTILDNIKYGCMDANFESVRKAAQFAQIDEYIMGLPLGYETNVGERGVKLSGGQKQRIAIARVFLKNPKILILDEATSALDNKVELEIEHALNKLSQNRTTLVVAHRLSTIKNADLIVYVDNGKIIEMGSHDELMNSKGNYYILYNLQFAD